MLLTKSELMGIDLAFEDVKIGKGSVRVREMTVGEYDDYQMQLVKIKRGADGKQIIESDLKDTMSLMLSYCLVNENMKPLMTKDEIKKLPAKKLKPLYDVAQRLNGDTLDESEAMEKNSEAVLTDS